MSLITNVCNDSNNLRLESNNKNTSAIVYEEIQDIKPNYQFTSCPAYEINSKE